MKALTILAMSRDSRDGALRVSIAIFLAMLIIAATTSSEFLTGQNIGNLISQTAPLVLASVGQMMVILTGGLDVSNGAVMSLTTTIVALPYAKPLTLFLALGAALLIGAINGIGVTRLGVHPIVMTLSTMSFAQGLALLLRPIPGGDVPAWLSAGVNGSLAGIPFAVLWIVLPVAAAAWLLYRRPFGLHLFAAGGNADNARMNGIKTDRVIVSAYMLSSLFAFFAGLYLAGRLSSGDSKVGVAFNLDSVTAVALGGVQLSGGVGNLFGTIIGALLVSLIGNAMNLSNVSAFIQVAVKGLLLVVVVSVQRRKEIGL
jgi:ribose transport system permease protein